MNNLTRLTTEVAQHDELTPNEQAAIVYTYLYITLHNGYDTNAVIDAIKPIFHDDVDIIIRSLVYLIKNEYVDGYNVTIEKIEVESSSESSVLDEINRP